MIQSIDHLNITLPKGRLDDALAFYVGLLNWTRIPKASDMEAKNGGAWLIQNGIHLHLSEEANFQTDGRSHTCFRVHDTDLAIAKAEAAGSRARRDDGPDGYRRASVWDPFGNRIEFIQSLNQDA